MLAHVKLRDKYKLAHVKLRDEYKLAHVKLLNIILQTAHS